MKIFFTHPNFKAYKFFIGEKEFPNEKVIEADDEVGYIFWMPDLDNAKYKKREHGRVHIVRFEGYDAT